MLILGSFAVFPRDVGAFATALLMQSGASFYCHCTTYVESDNIATALIGFVFTYEV
jgi:hypothetical protein